MPDVKSAFGAEFEGELPDTLDEAALSRLRTVAYVLDECIRLPGTNFRFGLDPILSVVPGAGDAVGAGVSLYVIAESAYLGVGPKTVLRMLANVGIDAVGGSVPIVGVVFDAVWKTNKRNVELAFEDLAVPEEGQFDEAGAVEIEVEEP
jgi:hypothetical protein